MGKLLLVIGIFFLGLGWTLFYRPSWLLYFNKIVREKLLNDGEMLLERRKKGFLFVLLAVISLYVGYDYQSYRSPSAPVGIVSTDRLLYKSLQHLYSKQYQKSKFLCEKILVQDPGNVDALYQLGAAQILMGEVKEGSHAWRKAAHLEPQSTEAEQLIKLIKTEKGQLVSFAQ